MTSTPAAFTPLGFRADGRNSKDLRPIRVTPGDVKDVQCSALYECGLTKVLCCIRGPSSSLKSRRSYLDSGFIAVHFEMPNSNTPELRQYESVIQSYLGSVLDLHDFPLTVLEVIIIPLCDDGGLLAASINAATAAVLQGGIPHKHPMGAAVSIGVADKALPFNDKTSRGGGGGEDAAILIDPLASEVEDCVISSPDTKVQFAATYIVDSSAQRCWGMWPERGNGATIHEMERMELWAKGAGAEIISCLASAIETYKKELKQVMDLNDTLLIIDDDEM